VNGRKPEGAAKARIAWRRASDMLGERGIIVGPFDGCPWTKSFLG
jgi:hypothetical protein